jgi:hypothetical protein
MSERLDIRLLICRFSVIGEGTFRRPLGSTQKHFGFRPKACSGSSEKRKGGGNRLARDVDHGE